MPHDTPMTSRERVEAAIRGEAVDHPPVSLWCHFPERDQTAEGLAASTIAWQRRHDFDLVKFMPPGDYPIIDWGGETVFEGSPEGTRTTTQFPIDKPEEWGALKAVEPHRGFNEVILDALHRSREGIEADVPIFQTIFSPLTIAMKLSDGKVLDHLRSHPDAVQAGLAVISDVTRRMLEASFDAGADGIFFATQLADGTVLDEATYRTFGLPYDLEVLKPAKGRGWTMLHLHGEAPMFGMGGEYPAEILNWHDRHASPDLATGERTSERCVAGGINEKTVATAEPADVAAEARDAVAQTDGRHLIVAPGCVVPVATPEKTIRAVIGAVRNSAAG
ncbi:MAG: uroporphyrinogen decarboxylase family protein [Thermomicrobiales bacterium]